MLMAVEALELGGAVEVGYEPNHGGIYASREKLLFSYIAVFFVFFVFFANRLVGVWDKEALLRFCKLLLGVYAGASLALGWLLVIQRFQMRGVFVYLRRCENWSRITVVI